MTPSPDLEGLAHRLAGDLLAGRCGPVLAAVATGAAAPLVAPLGGRHPLELLWGLRAPAHWSALVVVAPGRVVARAPVERGDVVVASVCGRVGTDRSVVLAADGRCLVAASEPAGLVPDAARRALGRPTHPPDGDPVGWWAGSWLAEAAGGDPGRARPLRDLLGDHPAVEGEDLPVEPGELVAFVVARGREHARLTGWEGVRRCVATGLLHDPWCPPALAAWDDAGSFSRRSLACRPAPGELLERLRPALAPGVAAAVGRVLAAWGLR